MISASTTFTVVDTTPPPAPTGLSVTPRSTGLFVDWTDSSATDFAGYDIALKVADPLVPQRRLESGYYMRQVTVEEI